MSLAPVVLATQLNLLLLPAFLIALIAFCAALVAAVRKKVVAAIGWVLLFGWCGAYVYEEIRPNCGFCDSGAAGDSRAIGSSEVAYSSSNGGYFGHLTCLSTPTSCGWPQGTTPFLDAQLGALSTKGGYVR